MEGKYRILYVDDEEDNLAVFKSYFRNYYEITTALNGKEAIQMLENQRVDLILSDHRMPGMSGVDMFETIQKRYPDIIRIILTAYSDIQAVINAINKGKIYHFATKPWDADELKNILDNALESYTLKQLSRRLLEENTALMLNAERLEKANILSQFEILKSKINPHFLFNSLNILGALIPENPGKAVDFIARFSKLYRRLLELHEQPLISLAEELEFAESYVYLQKMRFSDNLKVDIEAPDPIQRHCLPPFTLQILLENAIKHNIAAEGRPLRIRVAPVAGNKLEVSNTLQLRGAPAESTGLGLNILKSRYQLITPEPLEFERTEDTYIVRIPLVEEA